MNYTRVVTNLRDNSNQPTKEMVNFFENRTKNHIKLVQLNCSKLARVFKLKKLITQCKEHDKSKFSKIERIPYIWLTWFYKCKQDNVKFELPNSNIKKLIDKACLSHKMTNRHHPEFHKNVLNMTKIDLGEMVSDLTAMSMELGGNPKDYFNKNHLNKFKFSKKQLKLIYKMFNCLY